MNSFPFFTPLEANIVTAIQNVSREKFSGASPFVLFTDYVSTKTIGTNESYQYSNRGFDRFPPVITNLDIKPTGSMGVIREGSVTIKFASMPQLKAYQDFFRIGSAKSICWGWSKFRGGTEQTINPISSAAAKKYVANIADWQLFCGLSGYAKDVMVGPLMDFSITVNNDATVDVIFKVGSKSEISAFLGNTVKDKASTAISGGEEKLDGRISSLFNLSDIEFANLKSNFPEFQKHFINYNYANRGTISKGIGFLSETVGLSYDSTSDSVYIDMEWIVRFAINKNHGDGNPYIINIDNAIGSAHPNMLSNSENIIFTNEKSANPTKSGLKLILDTSNTQDIRNKVKAESYVQQKAISWNINGSSTDFAAGRWGFIKNIYVKQEFLVDLFNNHTNGNSRDVLVDICTEINKASAGLTDMAPQESSAKDEANMVYTIVDYALIPPNPPTVQTLNLFGENSTIIGINFNTDLPKEIAAMAMLKGRDQKDKEIGKNLFFAYKMDAGDVLGHNLSDKKIPIVGGNTPPPPKDILEKAEDVVVEAKEVIVNIVDKIITTASNIKESITGISGVIDENCTIVSKDKNEAELPDATDENGLKVSIKDTQLVKNLYFAPNSGTTKNNPLLPIELEITTLGISGVTVGKIVKISDLPFDDGKGLLQVVEVNHTVNASTWETTIKFKYRPGN